MRNTFSTVATTIRIAITEMTTVADPMQNPHDENQKVMDTGNFAAFGS